MSWYDGYSGDFDSAASTLHRHKAELFNLIDEYPEIFKTPNIGKRMYRGLAEDSRTLQRIVRDVRHYRLNPDGYFKNDKYSEFNINYGLVFKNIKYKPTRPVNSWSTAMYKETRDIYLASKIDKNCIMNPKSSYLFYPDLKQYEIIHFDNFDYTIDAVIASEYFNAETIKTAQQNLKLYTSL